NGRVRINLPLGSALTDVAALPAGARRSLDDPYEDREAASRRRRMLFWMIVLGIAAAAVFTRWKQQKTGRYFWQPAAASAPAQPPPAKNYTTLGRAGLPGRRVISFSAPAPAAAGPAAAPCPTRGRPA
ncbi:MAG: hypothetical protein ACKOTF_02910, partial [Opitutaceae bacterium]